MNSSPARLEAPEPQSWIPIDLLESLPDLEDLLSEENLVDSGQTRAVRADEMGRPLVYSKVDPGYDFEQELGELINEEARISGELRKHHSDVRSLKMQRKVKVQRAILGVMLVILVGGLAFLGSKSYFFSNASKTLAPRDLAVANLEPIAVPVNVEGKASNVLSVASTLDDFIKEHGLEAYVSIDNHFSRDELAAHRGGALLEFRMMKSISVTADGISTPLKSTALTVGEALQSNNVIYDGDDIVTPALDTALLPEATISIVRVTSSTRVQENVIAFSTVNTNDANLALGQTKVTQAGQNGTELVTYTQTLQDGNVVAEVVASREVTKTPVSKIIAVGTKKPVVVKKAASATASTGATRSTTTGGSSSGKASFYSHIEGTCAHKTLPMGTIITVTNVSNGKSTSCRVADRGPFVEGRIIDLDKGVFSQIASLSTGVINVTISY